MAQDPGAGHWGSDHGGAATTRSRPTEGNDHGQHNCRRRRPRVGNAVGGLAVAVMLVLPAVGAGAVSGASISPTTLSSSGQKFEVSYSGRSTKDQGGSLAVEECIADDRKPDFDPTADCSSLSRQYFFGLPESGKVIYGGQAANRTAPFVGLDPENGVWSLCGPDKGTGSHDRGYLRISESPSDLTSDFFVPFTCAVAGSGAAAKTEGSGTTGVVLAAGAGALAVACGAGMLRKRQRSRSSSVSR